MPALPGNKAPLIRYVVSCLSMALATVMISASAEAADDITVGVTLDRTSIGLDEQALLQVQVSGSVQDLPEPQLPTLPAFEIYSKGRSSNISIANGVMTSSLIYRYLVIPRKPGKFPIDGIAVVYNNKRYKGNSVILSVQNRGGNTSDDLDDRSLDSKGESRDYFLEAIIDQKSPFVNEQVTLTLKFFIAVQYYGSPELTEPTTTGFWTEVLGNKTPYYQSLSNRRYRVIERKYALFPTQTGELTIGRATIRATVAGKKRRSRDPFGSFNLDDFFGRGVEARASSQPLRINVKPIPPENRPEDFTGTIGRFMIRAEADKRQVEVNQPVTVKFRISGTGNVKTVAEPKLPEMEEFRIYRASSSEEVSQQNDKLGGTKVFEEVFIPRIPGDFEIPSVAFNYFDPNQGKYHRVATEPILITVTAPEGYSNSNGIPYSTPGLTIDSRARDIRYIKTDLGGMQSAGHLPVFNIAYVLANVLPLLGLLTTVLVRRRREKLAADTGRARARGAAKIAKKRLAQARGLANLDSVGEFYVEIYRALTSYFADKLNISPHGLTTDSIREELAKRSAAKELIDSFTGVITRCDYARFAPAALTQADIDDTLRESEEVIIRIEGVKFV